MTLAPQIPWHSLSRRSGWHSANPFPATPIIVSHFSLITTSQFLPSMCSQIRTVCPLLPPFWISSPCLCRWEVTITAWCPSKDKVCVRHVTPTNPMNITLPLFELGLHGGICSIYKANPLTPHIQYCWERGTGVSSLPTIYWFDYVISWVLGSFPCTAGKSISNDSVHWQTVTTNRHPRKAQTPKVRSEIGAAMFPCHVCVCVCVCVCARAHARRWYVTLPDALLPEEKPHAP